MSRFETWNLFSFLFSLNVIISCFKISLGRINNYSLIFFFLLLFLFIMFITSISDINWGPTFTSGKDPCGVCCKSVGWDCRTVSQLDSSQIDTSLRTDPQLTLPRWTLLQQTLPWPDNSTTGHFPNIGFPDWTFPRP